MGISRTAFEDADSTRQLGTRYFSSDVLKIELSGPNRSYFSILDLPGVFHATTQGLTKEEKDAVKTMVDSYMTPTESVIV